PIFRRFRRTGSDPRAVRRTRPAPHRLLSRPRLERHNGGAHRPPPPARRDPSRPAIRLSAYRREHGRSLLGRLPAHRVDHHVADLLSDHRPGDLRLDPSWHPRTPATDAARNDTRPADGRPRRGGGRMIGIGDIFNLQLAYDVLRVSTPLVLLALGALITDKAGVLNIALEGLLVFGAFAAVLGTGLSGNLVVGVLSAVVASGLLSLMFAASALYLRGNLFIVGLATNAFAAAVTTYAAWLISGREGSLRFPAAPTLPRIEVPVVEDVAALAWLSGHTVIDYLAWVTTAVVAYLLFRTRFGLRLRAAGEDASAARA